MLDHGRIRFRQLNARTPHAAAVLRAGRRSAPARGARTAPAPRILEAERLAEHVDRLHRAAWAMCGNPHDADDLVQETFVRLLARPRRVREASDLGYLLAALRNTYISQFRGRRRRPMQVELTEDFDGPAADARHGPEAQVQAREVFAALHRLPDAFGAAIMAVDVVGLTVAEAAQALGQQPRAIERHLARARVSIGRELAPGRAPRLAT
jgi:RNA polymerase sigma-70 factor, ECF subfamily